MLGGCVGGDIYHSHPVSPHDAGWLCGRRHLPHPPTQPSRCWVAVWAATPTTTTHSALTMLGGCVGGDTYTAIQSALTMLGGCVGGDTYTAIQSALTMLGGCVGGDTYTAIQSALTMLGGCVGGDTYHSHPLSPHDAGWLCGRRHLPHPPTQPSRCWVAVWAEVCLTKVRISLWK
ncbi:hypothetical protein Hamer_G003653 [Homarus americanus]|uniref:Uncharacterized protein n=1 Tax=Homarus americanus TaxID=6706 RepID=A0A8J5JUB5_HOMAM|nr:hypothetical protein Hamer_G003653 [Homarus americanus]